MGSSFLYIAWFFFMLVWVHPRICLAKECTNIPTQLSHTLRSAQATDGVSSSSDLRSHRVSLREISPHVPLDEDMEPSALAEVLAHTKHWTAPHVSVNRELEKVSLPEVPSHSRHRRNLLSERIPHPLLEVLSESGKDMQFELPEFSKAVQRLKRIDSSLLQQARSRWSDSGQSNSSVSKIALKSERINSSDSNIALKSERRNSSGSKIASKSEKRKSRRSLLEGHPALKEVSLHRVRLAADSMQGIAQETNLQYLLMLDVDSLVYNFRVTAGLSTPGSPYGGWEDPTMELRGHFVGHYMSAAAMMWASTHNAALEEKMATLVDALKECQDEMGSGYLSAFPSQFFDSFEAIRPVWAPYYTVHKIMAGLLDQHKVAGSEKALQMVVWMAKYFLDRVETVIRKFTIERHWNSLNEETGGMNDVMYRLFMVTGDPDHLKLAHYFDKPCFLGLLALQTDGLCGFHSNTHIPLVVGAQMRYEATGDKLYAELSEYFMKIVNSSHRYATGGTSVAEFWTYPNRNGDALSTEDQETCTTYNMLKVARNMYRWTKDVSYADYYERTLVNGILGIQRGKEPGVMIYMLPQVAGMSKAVSYHGWGTPYNAFWCCYGTGIESFSKLGDSIYFEDENPDSFTLRVAQYVSSNVTWDAVGLVLSQTVLPLSSNDPIQHVTFTFFDVLGGETGNQAELSLRIPTWTTASSQITLNGLSMGVLHPGKYFTLSRVWKAADILEVNLCMSLSLEQIQDDRKRFSSLHAVLFGPYLLAGMTDGEHEIEGVNTSTLSWIVPVPASNSAQLYSFSQSWSVKGDPNKFKALESDTQELRAQDFVLSSVNFSAGMKLAPGEGTHEAAQCTFLLSSASPADAGDSLIGRVITFELYSSPGRLLVHTGVNRKLGMVDVVSKNLKSFQLPGTTDSETDGSQAFKVHPGLSGDQNTVSFEAATLQGCYIASDVHGSITLQCQPEGNQRDPNFSIKASFTVKKGLATYHPVSFFAKGKNRQFLLFPIQAYLDERYATYFSLSTS